MVTNDSKADISDVTGFVLREFPYKETSKIVEVFAEDFGRISIIAKGVMSKKSKTLGVTQRFVKANYNLYKSGKEFYGIRDANLVKSYSKSNKNFDIILYKSAIADLLLRTLDQIQVDIVYNLLDHSFDAFENAETNQINIFLAFLLKYISFSGFKPNLTSCGVCGKKIAHGDYYFSPAESSLVCSDCKHLVHDKIYMTNKELAYAKRLLYTPSEDLDSIDSSFGIAKIALMIIDYSLDKLELPRYASMDWVYKKYK